MAVATQPVLGRESALRRPVRVGSEHADAADLDAALVERWRAGDEDAFAALVRRHEGRVFRIVLRLLGEREEAEDAAQETFLSIHRHRDRFRGDSRFSTWVHRVAVNAALNRRRTLGRRRTHLDRFARGQAAGEHLPHAPRGPEESLERRRLGRRVQRELLALAPRFRVPLVLHEIEGLGCGEIARVLGVAEGTVKSRLHRARRALHARLRDLAEGEGAQA